MDKETLDQRLKDLTTQQQAAQIRLQQANADLIAISGAMQEIGYWIDRLSPVVVEGKDGNEK